MSTPLAQSPKTLVVGATGLLGSEVVRLLVAAGHSVRAVVRSDYGQRSLARAESPTGNSLERLPIETVDADLKHESSLRAACEGIDTIISTATSLVSRSEGDTIRSVDLNGHLSLILAAKAANVSQFVFVSCIPNDIDYEFQTAKRRVEDQLAQSSLAHTVLQAAPFMEVWLGAATGFEPTQGHVRIFGKGDKPVSWVSIKDVARFAAAIPGRPRFADRTIQIGGPESLSPLDILSTFSEMGSETVDVERISERALEQTLRDANDPFEEAFAASALAMAKGLVADSGPALGLLPGRLVTVRDHLQQQTIEAARQPTRKHHL